LEYKIQRHEQNTMICKWEQAVRSKSLGVCSVLGGIFRTRVYRYFHESIQHGIATFLKLPEGVGFISFSLEASIQVYLLSETDAMPKITN
jgi:hypothetical protein